MYVQLIQLILKKKKFIRLNKSKLKKISRKNQLEEDFMNEPLKNGMWSYLMRPKELIFFGFLFVFFQKLFSLYHVSAIMVDDYPKGIS